MNLTFTPTAWGDYQWFQQRDRKLLKRINQLIEDTLRSPFEGIGKPEPLKGDLSGHWSRRITDEHRLVTPSRPTIWSSLPAGTISAIERRLTRPFAACGILNPGSVPSGK